MWRMTIFFSLILVNMIPVSYTHLADSQMKICASLPTGQSPGSLADWSAIRCNMGFLYGLLEEGGYGSTTGTANLLGSSKEALDMVNSCLLYTSPCRRN